MRVSQLILLTGALAVLSPSAMAAETINVAPFRSVELRDGGNVTLRAGASQRVTLVEGDTRFTHFTVEQDGQLVIETRCNASCPRNYRLKIEIESPALHGLAVDEGGSIVAAGTFPAQAEFAAAVNEGGHVDARAISAGRVHAAVNEGGNIMVTASAQLVAAVNGGGVIQYWGNPSSIRRAINDGGVIGPAGTVRGVTQVHAVTPVPAVPPVPPVHGTRVTHDSDDDYGTYDDEDLDEDEDADDMDDADDDSDE